MESGVSFVGGVGATVFILVLLWCFGALEPLIRWLYSQTWDSITDKGMKRLADQEILCFKSSLETWRAKVAALEAELSKYELEDAEIPLREHIKQSLNSIVDSVGTAEIALEKIENDVFGIMSEIK